MTTQMEATLREIADRSHIVPFVGIVKMRGQAGKTTEFQRVVAVEIPGEGSYIHYIRWDGRRISGEAIAEVFPWVRRR
jgi:hypothetical protein